VEKERGRFLSIMIALKIIAYLLTFYSIFLLFFVVPQFEPGIVEETVGTIKKEFENIPSWIKFYSLVDFLLGVITVWGVLKWRKWAAYLSIALFILGIFSSFLVSVETKGINNFFSMAITALWFWAIFRKWKNFI